MIHTIGSEGPCRRIYPSGEAKQQLTCIYRRMESSPEEATQETISTRRLLRAIRACTRDSPPSLAPLRPPPRISQSRFLAFSLPTDAGVMLLLCPGDGLPHGFLAGGLPAPLVAARGLSLHKCVFFMMPLGLRKRGTCFTQSGAGSPPDFSGPGSHLRPLHAGWSALPPLSWERGVRGELCNIENLAKLFLEEHAAADKRAVGISLKC